ncbi:YtxH domain-containing protein [Ruminiclostridium josui]|uniref:YtxH domain-containing protein n=1 Tax=Ruminiclostridium josui TaxID=1499 RepID=UPI0004651CE8|nr:YtxH domain-containing protein [Ruminiclostridium josui]
MLRNFTKGLVVGGLIGASISVLTNPEVVDPRMRRKMMKSGRKILHRSNNMFGEMIHMFR